MYVTAQFTYSVHKDYTVLHSKLEYPFVESISTQQIIVHKY